MPLGYGTGRLARPLSRPMLPSAAGVFSAHDMADEPSATAIMRRSPTPMTAAPPMPAAPTAPAAPAAHPPLPSWFASNFPNQASSIMQPPAARPGAGDPNYNPLEHIGANYPDLMSLVRDLIARGGAEGVFSPHYMRNALRRKALSNADAQRNRTSVLSRLVGLDPNQRAVALTDADLEANRGVSDALNQAEMGDLSQYSDLIRALLGTERGGESNLFGQREQRNWQQSQQGGIGSFLGQLVGGAAGDWLSPGGLLKGAA